MAEGSLGNMRTPRDIAEGFSERLMTVKVALSSRRRGLLIFETAFANKGHAVATFYAGLYGLKSQMLSTGRASDVGNSSFNWRPQKNKAGDSFFKIKFYV